MSKVPPTPAAPPTASEKLVSLIVDDLRTTIDQSELGRIVKWGLKTAAPMVARWVLELLVIRFAPMVAPVVEIFLPWLMTKLNSSAAEDAQMLAAVVKMSPSDFHSSVRKSMAASLSRAARNRPDPWLAKDTSFPGFP